MREELIKAIADMNEQGALKLAADMLEQDVNPHEILDAGSAAMELIGQRYDSGEYYLPELLLAGEMMRQIGEMVKPKLRGDAEQREPLGKIVIGTVAGDIHDIGKDVVSFILDINNYEVHDLGVDVPQSKFVDKIKEVNPDVVGLSGFLTLAFDQMKNTVEAIAEAGLREKVKIMIGGAVMNEEVTKYTGADAYGKDATTALRLSKKWTGGK